MSKIVCPEPGSQLTIGSTTDVHPDRASSNQSSGAHTPGPWKVSGLGYISGNGKVLARTEIAPAQYQDRIELSMADARRIVACVNYCEGVPTETLESDFAIGRSDRLAYEKGCAELEVTRLAALNKELVEALEHCLPAIICATDGQRYVGGHELEARIAVLVARAQS